MNHVDKARPDGNVKADAIVVLTGGESRVTEAVRLLASERGRRLLISGVHPKTTGAMLRRVNPEARRLFDCCIDLDRNARDTIENADGTRRWLAQRRFRSVIVVTSSYHMPRGLVELRRALPELKLIPYPVVPAKLRLDAWWRHPKTFSLVASEFVKYLASVGRCAAVRFIAGGPLVERIRGCFDPVSL
ncbi:MAG: YdcF family protein [Dichotomicrobium sp.]